nr:hypothetical protein JVH1_4173 [Rhodococcus sp. JVH1]
MDAGRRSMWMFPRSCTGATAPDSVRIQWARILLACLS